MEVTVAASMTAFLLVSVLVGIVSLQHSYTSTEEDGVGQAGTADSPSGWIRSCAPAPEQ